MYLTGENHGVEEVTLCYGYVKGPNDFGFHIAAGDPPRVRVPIWSFHRDEFDQLMDAWEEIVPKPSVLKKSGTAMSSGTFENVGVVHALKHETSSSGCLGSQRAKGWPSTKTPRKVTSLGL
jgi:hypothetical protein